jgi:UDP-N-acetylmuramoyl-tripeptide--D-alanyl-D-alanine ligase
MQHIWSALKAVAVWILTLEARILLSRMQPKIVAITGSIGKTSTKDAIFTAFSGSARVRKSDKSYNSDVGVPLTILGLKNPGMNPVMWLMTVYEGALVALFAKEYPEWLVLEIGADHPGDIKRITSWLKPDASVLTAVPDVPVHVEFFASMKQVLAEKRKLVEARKPKGTAIIFADTPGTAAVAEATKGTVFTYGYARDAYVRIVSADVMYDAGMPRGMKFTFVTPRHTYHIPLHGTLGAHHAYPIAAGIAFAESHAVTPELIEQRFSTHEAPYGRMHLVRGMNDSLIVDDSYNASPDAMKAALLAIKNVTVPGKKIAILGDMNELGKHTTTAHTECGELAGTSVDYVATFGARAKTIGDAAREKLGEDRVHEFKAGEWKALSQWLQGILQKGDIVLVKGSQLTRLERIVESVLADQADVKYLVRQDEEWRGR